MTMTSDAAKRAYPFQMIDFPSYTPGLREAFDAGRNHEHGPCDRCGHTSDCATHNAPALPMGDCDCRYARES